MTPGIVGSTDACARGPFAAPRSAPTNGGTKSPNRIPVATAAPTKSPPFTASGMAEHGTSARRVVSHCAVSFTACGRLVGYQTRNQVFFVAVRGCRRDLRAAGQRVGMRRGRPDVQPYRRREDRHAHVAG